MLRAWLLCTKIVIISPQIVLVLSGKVLKLYVSYKNFKNMVEYL